MGTCTSSTRPLRDVFIPFPTTLEDFQTFGHVNMLKCLHLLNARARREASKPGSEQLQGPYTIKAGKGATISDVVVLEPAIEIQRIMTEYARRDVSRCPCVSLRGVENR